MVKKFRYQFIPGPCAQFALINAMAVLGIKLTASEAYRLTGVSLIQSICEGTDTPRIVRAIRKCGCIPHLGLRQSEGAAQHSIDRFLARGWPVIISVNESRHWAVLASKTKSGKYRWIDSYDKRVVGYWRWSSLAEWMEDAEDKFCYIGVGSDHLRVRLNRDEAKIRW